MSSRQPAARTTTRQSNLDARASKPHHRPVPGNSDDRPTSPTLDRCADRTALAPACQHSPGGPVDAFDLELIGFVVEKSRELGNAHELYQNEVAVLDRAARAELWDALSPVVEEQDDLAISPTELAERRANLQCVATRLGCSPSLADAFLLSREAWIGRYIVATPKLAERRGAEFVQSAVDKQSDDRRADRAARGCCCSEHREPVIAVMPIGQAGQLVIKAIAAVNRAISLLYDEDAPIDECIELRRARGAMIRSLTTQSARDAEYRQALKNLLPDEDCSTDAFIGRALRQHVLELAWCNGMMKDEPGSFFIEDIDSIGMHTAGDITQAGSAP